MSIYIADCESTGLIEPIQPIELAWLKLEWNEDLTVLEEFNQRYKPDKDIEYGALATSHILPSELKNERPWTDCAMPEDTEYLIGQNIDYDWNILGQPEVKRICTKAMAQVLIPNIDSYSQSALLYYVLGEDARELLKEAHNALCDIKNNRLLLEALIAEYIVKYNKPFPTIEELYAFSEDCRVPAKLHFGKYKGMPYTSLDYGYVQWWMTKSDTPPNEYQKKALRKAGFRV